MHPSITRFKVPLSLNREVEYLFLLCLSPAFLNHVFVIFETIFVTKSLHKKTSLTYNIAVFVTMEFYRHV